MKMEENVNPNELVEENHEQDVQNSQDENNNKLPSDERKFSKRDTQRNTKAKSLSIRQSRSTYKKSRCRFSPTKQKRINMYLVLTIYCLLLLAALLLSHHVFNDDIHSFLTKDTTFTFLLFIILLVGSLIFSLFASYCECLIKTHLFGILFFIVLNLANDYCIVYLSSLNSNKYFEQFFCGLIILVSGSLGLLIITLVVKDEVPSLFVLFLFSSLFSVVGGLIMCGIYNNFWNIFFSVLAFLISEFNIYSSQYQLGKKKKKKEPMVYSQPFELIISIFKLFYFVLYFVIIIIKSCFKACKSEGEKGNNTISQQRNESLQTIGDGGEGKGEGEGGREGGREGGEEEGNGELADQQNGSQVEIRP